MSKDKENTMTRTHQIYDRDGNLVDGDIIPDGGRLVVPLMCADAAMDPVQRAVIKDKLDTTAHRFGVSDALALHKPGQRFCTDQQARDATEQARNEMITDLVDAWRTPPTGAGEREFVGAREGDTCTVREGGGRFGAEGSSGRLKQVGGRLVCVANQQGDAADTREAALADYINDLTNAWRTPHG
jgi:hypothetical protein